LIANFRRAPRGVNHSCDNSAALGDVKDVLNGQYQIVVSIGRFGCQICLKLPNAFFAVIDFNAICSRTKRFIEDDEALSIRKRPGCRSFEFFRVPDITHILSKRHRLFGEWQSMDVAKRKDGQTLCKIEMNTRG